MTSTTQDPINPQWTTPQVCEATAAQVAHRLGDFRVDELPPHLTPYLAAAGTELANAAKIGWHLRSDEDSVALLRLISRSALVSPDTAGPHAQRLLAELDKLKDSPTR